LWDESVLIGRVSEADGVAVRTSVGVGALNCLRLSVRPSACVLQETLLLGSGTVSRLVTVSDIQENYRADLIGHYRRRINNCNNVSFS
jgi:hypothetical protein